MSKKPILFNAEMVRAILDGRKTQTRRIFKMPKHHGLDLPWQMDFQGVIQFEKGEKSKPGMIIKREIWKDAGKYEHSIVPCPFGIVGDELWVKEEHYQWGYWVTNGNTKTGKDAVAFSQCGDRVAMYPDAPPVVNVAKNRMTPEKAWHKRNSLFMPQWASRIQLKITDIRVERVQEITVKDALSEGIQHNSMNYPPSEFAWLWNSINTEPGKTWYDNPYVWVVEFERVK